MKSSLGERREEQIGPRQTPHDRPLRPRGDPGREKSGRRAINRPGSTSSAFMKSTMSETAPWQDVVDLRHSKRKTACLLHAISLDRGDAFAQISKDLISQDSRHRSRNPFRLRGVDWRGLMPPKTLMFLFCSFMRTESRRSKIGIQSHSVSDSADFLFESAC